MTKMMQRKSLRVGAGQGAKPGRQPERREIPLEELKAILERARAAQLSEEDIGKLEGAVDTLAFLTGELEAKGTSIKRLRQMLFGASTEKTSNLFGGAADDEQGSAGSAKTADEPAAPQDRDSSASPEESPESTAASEETKRKRKGHGRNGAASYTGAAKIAVPHGELHHGDHCPFCEKGKVYVQPDPAVLLRVTGMAPLSAKLWELQRLRCNLCGEVVTAQAPEGAGSARDP